MCSPGLAYDPSSIDMHAATARLTGAMQGLQGSGSRPCLFVRRMIPIGPQPFCGPLSTVKPHSHGAASCARLRRPGCDAPVRSRGWCARRAAGRVRSRRLAVTCAADKGARAPTAVLGLRRGARSGELRRESSAYLEHARVSVCLFPCLIRARFLCVCFLALRQSLCFKGTSR